MFGNVAQISFNAQPTGTGVATNENSDGKGKVNARAPATTRNGYPIGEFTFKGTVDCYVQDGTVAWFSGVIDKGGFGVTFPVVGPPAPGQYTHFLVAVKDNGEPGDGGPDMVRTRVVLPGAKPWATGPVWGYADADCANPDKRIPAVQIDWPVFEGNLQVHPTNG